MRRVERVLKTLLVWLEKSDMPPSLWPEIGDATLRGFDLIFPQAAQELLFPVTVYAQHFEINVWVKYREECWDIILWLDVGEVRKGAYFTCDLCCQEGEKKRFLSRYELYADNMRITTSPRWPLRARWSCSQDFLLDPNQRKYFR